MPTDAPKRYQSSIVETKKETMANNFATLVFLERVSVILVLPNSTLFAAEKRLQTEQKESMMAKVYI